MATATGAEKVNACRTTAWHDTKRYAWLLGLAIPMLPFIAAGLVKVSGWGLFWWSGPMFVFGILPLLDTIIGKDSGNPPDSIIGALERDPYYRWCVYLFLPAQFASLLLACATWSSGTLCWIDSIGLAMTVGVAGGVAISAAHELGHKSERTERWLSKVALAQTGYGHFFVEHNRGHHMRVATPEDPASSRLGESVWAFLPRSVAGSLQSAWAIEKRRLQRKGEPVLSMRNDIINAWSMTLVLYGVLAGVFGASILPWLIIQAVAGFSLLEVVNYLEHYGLARRKRPDGRYERCAPSHSWNSNSVASNVLLYHLQRHSDHHAYPSRRYQALRSFDEAPELPSGYGTMAVVALITPLWRRIMDPRVTAHYRGDLSLANVHPSKRKQYGPEEDRLEP
jgi:alkane 1-monooxygenase